MVDDKDERMSDLTEQLRERTANTHGDAALCARAADALEIQEERIEELKTALRFYSHDTKYSGQTVTRSCGCCSDFMEPEILEDKGNVAIEALYRPDQPRKK